jgi:hypothetical protein
MSDEELKDMPAALRRQVRAEEAAEAKAAAQPPSTPPPTPQEPPASEPPVESGQQPEPQEQPQHEPQEPVGGEVSPQPESVSKADLDKMAAEMKKELAEAEHRFKTLQGKYNAEIPRLQAERDELRRRFDDLSQKREEKPEPSVPTLPGPLRYLDEEERETLKSEPLSPEVRQAKGIAEDIVVPLREEINTLKREITVLRGERTQEQSRSRADRLWDAVEKRLPGAREINERDDGFRDFLNLPDPDNADGLPFAASGAAALENGDVATVVRIISSYAKSRGNGDGEPAPVPPVKPSESRGTAPTKRQTLPPVRQSEIGEWDHILVTKGPDEDRVADFLTRKTGKPWTAKDVMNRTKELNDALRTGRVIRG